MRFALMPIAVYGVYNILNMYLEGLAFQRDRCGLVRMTDRFRRWRIGRFPRSGSENVPANQ